MATGTGTIVELRLEADGLSGRIALPPGLRPGPGQYLMAAGPDYAEPLATALYPSALGSGDLFVAPPLPPTWSVGMTLTLRGPLGSGFKMPAGVRRIALAGLERSPARLMPLAVQGVAQRSAVTLFAQTIPHGLPEEVEVLPLDQLPEALDWADFLAVDVALHHLPELRGRLGLKPYQRLNCEAQVLLASAMPCAGMAECGVCAVAVHGRWALACTDGPVFDFNQLEGN